MNRLDLTRQISAFLIATAPTAPLQGEMPQTIFGKEARVVCEVYRRVHEAGRPAQRFMRCRVVPTVRP